MKTDTDERDFQQIHNFFMAEMVSKEGGVYTNYQEADISAEDEITRGHYILSESQGLLLEYAVDIEDKQLFLRTWKFLKDYMISEYGSFVWRVTPAYQRTSSVTATIDDLQIVLQLVRAGETWPDLRGGLHKEIEVFVKNFSRYTYWGYLTNGYDYQSQDKLAELNSSYIHLRALREIQQYAKDEELQKLYASSRELLKGMYIGNEFPFTHRRFYIETQMIEQTDEINMIEALQAALHLAQNNELRRSTKKWLDKHIDEGIFGNYNLKGEPVSEVESSAIYGIVAQIAFYEKDQELYQKAIQKGTDLLRKAIENPREAEILSYDNLQLLIAYAL